MPTLTIQLPGRPPVDHVLREESITLGRMAGSSIALDDSSVSQSHATIARSGSDYFLKDLKSTNGTMLNGQSISEARLRDGDQLRLGAVVAVFRLEPVFAPGPTSVIPATTPEPPLASRAEKADTAILSAKAKTTLLKPVSSGASVISLSPPTKRTNPITLVASILGGVAVAGVVGFVVWKLAVGGTARPAIAEQPNPPPRPAPTQRAASTDTPAVTAEASPAIEPATTNPAPPLPVAEAPRPPVPQTTRSLPELLAALRSSNVIERRHAAEAMSTPESGATNVLLNLRVALLQDSDPEVRLWLVVALANNQTCDQSTIPMLVEGLSNENATLRQRACAALALIPSAADSKATLVPALKAATEDASEDVRKAALATLKVIAPEEVPGK